MRRSKADAPLWSLLLAGMLGMLWRCRLEFALAALVVVLFMVLAGLVGDAAAGLVGLVLAVPVLRGWLLRALRAAWVRRAWWRAWTDCELPRVRAVGCRRSP